MRYDCPRSDGHAPRIPRPARDPTQVASGAWAGAGPGGRRWLEGPAPGAWPGTGMESDSL